MNEPDPWSVLMILDGPLGPFGKDPSLDDLRVLIFIVFECNHIKVNIIPFSNIDNPF